MQEAKMVKVRIAVAINDEGEYYAYGTQEADDLGAMREAVGNLSGDIRMVHFVEVLIPTPTPQTFYLCTDEAKRG